jgi:hypothetical protein
VGDPRIGIDQQLLPSDDHSDLSITTKYGPDLDAISPQRCDQLVDCHSPRLGGSIIGFPVSNAVDMDIGGNGELLLCQAGEYSRGA